MGNYEGAKEASHTPLHHFANRLILVVPHRLNVLAPWPKKVKDPETGEEREEDAYQHHVSVVTLEPEDRRDDNDNRVKYEAKEVHFTFLGAAKVMRQLDRTGVNKPILGRLKKDKPNAFGAKPWILKAPTDDDVAKADSFQPELDEIIEEIISDYAERAKSPAARATSEATVVEEDDTAEEGAPRAPYKRD